MKKIYYEKVGRRYVPVMEYDSDMLDAFSKGAHLVMSYPGGQSRRYNIDLAFAPMIAAGLYAEDAMTRALVKASELKPQKTPLTLEQKVAWENLAAALGDELATLQGASLRECAEAGIKAMQDEANKLLTNPAVQNAYDHFMLVCKLTKEHENT